MDLQTLRFFVAAAETGSFSAAAERMHYAQSNLSSRIKLLEDELGEALFYRSKRGVSLTAKGKVFYDYSTRVLKLSEEAVSVIRDMDYPRGHLSLGSLSNCRRRHERDCVSLFFPPCISRHRHFCFQYTIAFIYW